MSLAQEAIYPSTPPDMAASECAIDLDAVRRICLRAPMLGDSLSLQAATFCLRVDRMLEQPPLARALLLAHALAEVAQADPGCAAIFKNAGLSRQIRDEVNARRAGRAVEQAGSATALQMPVASTAGGSV